MGPKKPDEEKPEGDKKQAEKKDLKKPTATPPISAPSSRIFSSGRRPSTPTISSPLNPSSSQSSGVIKKDTPGISTPPLSKNPRPQTPATAAGAKIPRYLQSTASSKARASPPLTQQTSPLSNLVTTPTTTPGLQTGDASGSKGGNKQSLGSLRPPAPAEETSPAPSNISGEFSDEQENDDTHLSIPDTSPTLPPLNLPQTPSTYTSAPKPLRTAHRPSVTLPPNPNVSPQSDLLLFPPPKLIQKNKPIPASLNLGGGGDGPMVKVEPATPDTVQDSKQGEKEAPVFDPNRLSPAVRRDAKGKGYLKEFREFVITPLSLTAKGKKIVSNEETSSGDDNFISEENLGGNKDEDEKKDSKGGMDEQGQLTKGDEEASKYQDPSEEEDEDDDYDDEEEAKKPRKKKKTPYFEPITKFPPRIADSSAGVYVPAPDEFPLPQSPESQSQSSETTYLLNLDLEDIINQAQGKKEQDISQSPESQAQSPGTKVPLPLDEDENTAHSSAGSSSSDDKDEDGGQGGKITTAEEKTTEEEEGRLRKFLSPPGGEYDEDYDEKEESKPAGKAKKPPKPSPQGHGNRGGFRTNSGGSLAPRTSDRGLITGGGRGLGIFSPLNPTSNPTIPSPLPPVADESKEIEVKDYQVLDLEESSQSSPPPRPQPARIFARPVVPPFPVPRPSNTPHAPVDDVHAPRTTGPGDKDSIGEQFLDQVRRGNEEIAELERRKREVENRDREKMKEREGQREKEKEKEREKQRQVQDIQARRPENAPRKLPKGVQDFREFVRNNPNLSWIASAKRTFDYFEAVNAETQAEGHLRAQQLADGARAYNALQDVNNDLTNQLGQLQKTNDNLRARIMQLRESHKDEVNRLEDEIEDASRDNEDADERLNKVVDRELRVLREEYETEIEKLKDEHAAEIQAQHETIHKLEENAKAAVESHEKAIQKLKDKHYVETREDQEVIRKLNEEARDAAKAHKEEIHQQKEKSAASQEADTQRIHQLEKDLKDTITKTQGNEDELKKQLKNREAEIKNLQNNLETANGMIQKLDKDLKAASTGKQGNSNNELNKQLKDLQAEVKKLHYKLKTANEELARDKKLFDDQKREINDMKANLRDEKATHKEEIKNLSDKNTISMVEHKRRLKEQRNADEAQMVAERRSLQDTINKLEEELNELDAKPKVAETPKGMITEAECKKRNTEEANRLDAEIKKLENINAGLVEHHATQVNRANKLQEQLDALGTAHDKEVADLEEKFETAQTHVLTLQVRLVKLQTAMEQSAGHAMLFGMQERLEEAEKNYNKAMTKVGSLEARLQNTANRKAAYKKQSKTAEKDVQELQKEVAELKAATQEPADNTTVTDLRQQLATAGENLHTAQAEIAQLRAATTQTTSNNAAAALLQQLQTAEARLATLEERNHTVEEELARLRAEAEDWDQEEEYNGEEEYGDDSYGENDWNELQAYIVELKARLTEAQSPNPNPLRNLQQTNLSGINHIPGDEENLSDSRMLERLADMLGYYRGLVAIEEQTLHEHRLPRRLNKLRALERDNSILTARVSELEAEIRRLIGRLQAQTQEADSTAQATSLNEENRRLTARVNSLETDNYRLKAQVDELYEDNQRVTDLTSERDLARDNLATLRRDFDELQGRFNRFQEDLKARGTDLTTCNQEKDDLRDKTVKNLRDIEKLKKRVKDLEARLNAVTQTDSGALPEPRPEGEAPQVNPSIVGFEFAITRTRNFFRIMRRERAVFGANPPDDVASAVEAVQEALDIANALPEEINAPQVAQAELEAGIAYYYAANIDEADLHFAAADVLRENLSDDEAALLDRWIAWIAAGNRVATRREGYMAAGQRASERMKRDSTSKNATPEKKPKGKSSKIKSEKSVSKQSRSSKKKTQKDPSENTKKRRKKDDQKDKKSSPKDKSKKVKNLVGVVRYPIRLASWQQLRNLRRRNILIDPVDDNGLDTESRYLTTAQMLARNINHPNQEEMLRLEKSMLNEAGREQGPLSMLLGSLWGPEVPRAQEEEVQEEELKEDEQQEDLAKDQENQDVPKPEEQGTFGRLFRSLRRSRGLSTQDPPPRDDPEKAEEDDKYK